MLPNCGSVAVVASYTGTEPPESCIFSQLLNIAAVVGKIAFSLHLQLYSSDVRVYLIAILVTIWK